MTTSLVLTFIGHDKPGLVNAISEKVAASGGSWLDSRLAHLAGEFAGILLVSVPESNVSALTDGLRDLETNGLRVTVGLCADAGPAKEETRSIINLDLVGLDRPGIVRDVTQTLTRLKVNIEEFTSSIESAPFTGEDMFRAALRLRPPSALANEEMRTALEQLAREMMVDFTVTEGPSATVSCRLHSSDSASANGGEP